MKLIEIVRLAPRAWLAAIAFAIPCGCGDEGDTIHTTESYAVPGAPENIQASAGENEVVVSWSPVRGATSYNIYWNTTGNVTTADEVIINASSPYNHLGLTNATTYHYVVTAVNIEGESAPSIEASTTPQDLSGPPSAPGNVQAIAKDGQVTLSWAPISGATTYNIYWDTVGGVTKADHVIGTSTTLWVHPDLTNWTTYYYAVTAIDADGESDLSAEVSALPRVPFLEMLKAISAGDAQASDDFGYSVAISGDYAIVGARYEDGGSGDPLVDAGAAYLFHRTGANTWDAGTKVVAPDARADDRFGASVAISGDYAIVGAFFEDGGSGDPLSSSGSAYVFHRTGTNAWDAGTRIAAVDAQVADQFGYSVAISGDYAIVGADYEDGGVGDPLANAGAAYIFRRTGPNSWDAGAKITATDPQAGDNFGHAVAIDGDYAIVAAHMEDGGAGDPLTGAGAVYLYHRTGTNAWDAGVKIVASDPQANDQFGYSVAISGDYVVVGAVDEDGGIGNPILNMGAAYIYRRIGANAWGVAFKIVAPDAQVADSFGSAVSLSGDVAIVGARDEDGGAGDPFPNAGAAYIYHRTGTNTWDAGTRIDAADPHGGDWFGAAVSISGDYAIVGAHGGGSVPGAGSACIY